MRKFAGILKFVFVVLPILLVILVLWWFFGGSFFRMIPGMLAVSVVFCFWLDSRYWFEPIFGRDYSECDHCERCSLVSLRNVPHR